MENVINKYIELIQITTDIQMSQSSGYWIGFIPNNETLLQNIIVKKYRLSDHKPAFETSH